MPPRTKLASPNFTPHVGVVTVDRDVLRSAQQAVLAMSGRLTVASDLASAEQLLASYAPDVVLIDFAARSIVPSSIFRALDVELLLVHRDRAEDGAASEIRFSAFRRAALDAALDRLRALLPRPSPVDGWLLGSSAAIEEIRTQIARLARFPDVPVLILGETGTGKERVASAIHAAIGPADRPFVAINCAAIPEALFESELFGHESGAFTGARGARVGLLEAAKGGTLFLDEVGEMPPSIQPKLLRALESRTFRRVGSNVSLSLDARVVSATNRADGAGCGLRTDLYYRLAGFHIRLPALRARKEDVPMLALHFLDAFADRNAVPRFTMGDDALEALTAYDWPGNVRELRAAVECAAITASGSRITRAEVDVVLRRGGPACCVYCGKGASDQGEAAASSSHWALRDLERQVILDAFDRNAGNVSRTATELQIPRSTLRGKLRKYRSLAEHGEDAGE